jgi:hypothetical protein
MTPEAREYLVSVLFGILRHLLTGVGVWLMSHGVVNDAQWAQTLAGLSLFLVMLAWSYFQKRGQRKEEKEKVSLALGLPEGFDFAEFLKVWRATNASKNDAPPSGTDNPGPA